MDMILKYFSEFSDTQLQQLRMLEPLYRDWNSKINIISRKDMDGLYEKHVLHSLSIAAVFDFAPGTSIIDIGTGGGFPGIPLAIYFPEVQFHLVDSIGKKLKVVEAVAKEIGLENITTRHTRAEEIKNIQFDFAVSRAVAPLKDLWTWSRPLLRKNSASKAPNRDPIAIGSGVQNTGLTHDSRLSTPDSQLPVPDPGLICLKGGDLAKEIQESGLRPRMIEIAGIFPEDSFREKYLLYVPR